MTDHPNARDYANKAERAEQEATEAWACADRLAKALAEITRRTGLLILQNTGRWNMTVEHDKRTVGVLGVNQDIATDALAAYREKRG